MVAMLKLSPKPNMLTFITARSSPTASFKMWKKERKSLKSSALFPYVKQKHIREERLNEKQPFTLKKFQSWDWQKAGNRQNVSCDGRDGGEAVAVSANWRWWSWGDCRTAEGKQSLLGCRHIQKLKTPQVKDFTAFFNIQTSFFKPRLIHYHFQKKKAMYSLCCFFSSWGDRIIFKHSTAGKTIREMLYRFPISIYIIFSRLRHPHTLAALVHSRSSEKNNTALFVHRIIWRAVQTVKGIWRKKKESKKAKSPDFCV